MTRRLSLGLAFLLVLGGDVRADSNVRVEERKDGGISILRPTVKEPIFVFNAPVDGRPYVHPMLAPDGNGMITEFSPGHHKHQTGIYIGFLKVNGRDYFHNRGGDYFRRTAFKHSMNSEGVQWTSTYELLDKDKNAQLVETQSWIFRDFTKTYLIDLTLSMKANADVTFDKYEYGGLFLRMPWKNQPGAKAINSEGQINAKAEGQKASWVDIGMTVDGRKDDAHLAVISANPVAWRVDGQLGVGPAPSREKAWTLKKGDTATLRYRFYVYTGEFQRDRVDAESTTFGKIK
jgi:Family of unknown function (DUF6807)